MAISQTRPSEQTPSKFNSKLKQKSTWDAKRNLAKKRLTSLTQKTKNEEPEDDMDRPLICFKGETSENIDPPNECCSVSTSAVERAEEIRANLSWQFPSFTKLMLKSHVTGCFCLALPKQFCNVHLPNHDETVVLVDENGKEYDTKYLVHKNGLSGGWRGFSIKHKLLEGDVLVFQLVEPLKFKVYIARACSLTELDGAIGLLNLDRGHAKPVDAEFLKMEDQVPDEIPPMIGETEHQKKYSEPHSFHDDKNYVNISDDEGPLTIPISADDDDESDKISSGIFQSIRFSESVLNFKDVKCFEDFSIQVDGGLILDSEIPRHLRDKYYHLCRSQNLFLHDHLIKGLNIKLVLGMISETINIADGIRVAKSTMPLSLLESWDRTLKAFEDLGMVVGFLRARIHKLLAVYHESHGVVEAKRKERAEAEEMMREIKAKLLKIKRAVRGLDDEIEGLKGKNEELGFAIKEIVGASW